MLETIRQYAEEKLASTTERSLLFARHRSYYLALAERGEDGLDGPTQVEWLERLDREHDNLRAALVWSIERGEDSRWQQSLAALGRRWGERGCLREALRGILIRGDVAAGLRLGGSLWKFWLMCGYLTESSKLLQELLRLAGEPAAKEVRSRRTGS